MSCIDRIEHRSLAALSRTAAIVALGLSGCASPPPPPTSPPAPAARAARTPAPAPAARAPAERAATSMAEYKHRAALRIVQANPSGTYTGRVIEPTLAAPVLEVEVNADGSIRRINVVRAPSEARDTVDLARRAIERAAPFGDASRLPRPWSFLETFLFDGDRRFKPRSLDQ